MGALGGARLVAGESSATGIGSPRSEVKALYDITTAGGQIEVYTNSLKRFAIANVPQLIAYFIFCGDF